MNRGKAKDTKRNRKIKDKKEKKELFETTIYVNPFRIHIVCMGMAENT